MSDYIPPAGDAITLDIPADPYSPPAGDAIVLDVKSDDDLGFYKNQAFFFMFLG